MPDTKSPTDLSLDEILATMRRIIDEDEHAAAPAAARISAAEPPAAEPPLVAPPVAEPPVAEPASQSSGGDGEPQGNEGGVTTTPKPGAGGDDVLELTEALNEDGTVRHLSPIGFSRTHRAAEPAAPEKEAREARSGPAEVVRFEPLLSEAGAAATAAAFAHLSTIPRVNEAPAGPRVGDRALEDIVTDLLRPLLRTWLDDNLPALVERLVQREIDRAVSRSGSS
jgi:cell pole-organizing protein PopZ